jgi:O-acetyl-ADP-ribose deacetylase (regulator of RNase III)
LIGPATTEACPSCDKRPLNEVPFYKLVSASTRAHGFRTKSARDLTYEGRAPRHDRLSHEPPGRGSRKTWAMEIEVVRGNIVRADADVIVTAANHALIGGGGVDGAVHDAAGPELLAALRPLAPRPPGSAVITPAFGLGPRVTHVVHAVGPRYRVDEPTAELLASAYLASLALCDEVGAASVAFPALSTGAFGYPLHEACKVSVRALRGADTRVHRCLLVAFDERTSKFWTRALSP